jgi:dTDP-4-dehydrorhamnose reductase
MKFLVTGSAGLIGSQVVKDLTNSKNQVYSCYHNSKPEFGIPTQLDLLNPENIIKTIENIKPDAIIHLAAMTNVDLCEKEKDLALKINAKATEIISQQAAKHNSFFVYVSTDYVFDGEKGMKKENDATNPIDHYGKSKLEGENAVRDLASSWCIVRTSTPFGIHPQKKSFPLFVIENLKAKKEISVITDQYTSPTYVPNLSKMVIEIATRQIVGIMHVAGATRISRYEMAELIADKLSLDKKLFKPTIINEMNWIAKRPKDSSLDVSQAFSILNEKPQAIEQSLDYFIQELNH